MTQFSNPPPPQNTFEQAHIDNRVLPSQQDAERVYNQWGMQQAARLAGGEAKRDAVLEYTGRRTDLSDADLAAINRSLQSPTTVKDAFTALALDYEEAQQDAQEAAARATGGFVSVSDFNASSDAAALDSRLRAEHDKKLARTPLSMLTSSMV